jgi:hypothetical protein
VFYDYKKFGDRTLAIWVLRNIFVFTTYDYEQREKNLDRNIIKITRDIEGRWLFVQFSYSMKKKLAVAFVSQGDEESTSSLRIPCTHVPSYYLRLIIGG